MTILATLTFFCACDRCTGGNDFTALGTMPRRYVTIAAPRSVPLGTVVFVEGFGRRVVETRTRKDIDGWDIYVGNDSGAHQRAKRMGKQLRRITLP